MDEFAALLILFVTIVFIGILVGFYRLEKQSILISKGLLKAISDSDQRTANMLKQIKPTIKVVEKPIYIEKPGKEYSKGAVYSPDSDVMAQLEGRKVEMFD